MEIGTMTEKQNLEYSIEKLTHITVYGCTISPFGLISVPPSVLPLNGLPTKDEVIKLINDEVEAYKESYPGTNIYDDRIKYNENFVKELSQVDGDDVCGYLAASNRLIPVKYLAVSDEESSKKGTDILNMYPPPRIISHLHRKLTDFWNRNELFREPLKSMIPNSVVYRIFREAIESGEIKVGNQVDFVYKFYSPKNFEKRLREALTERYKQNLK